MSLQSDIEICDGVSDAGCGERCAVTQTSPLEFEWTCSKHGKRSISWAHADPPPQFVKLQLLFASEQPA